MVTDYYFGMNLLWWFLWVVLIFWIFVIPYDIPGQRNRKNSPLDILKRRLASGEIKLEEYNQKKAILEDDIIFHNKH